MWEEINIGYWSGGCLVCSVLVRSIDCSCANKRAPMNRSESSTVTASIASSRGFLIERLHSVMKVGQKQILLLQQDIRLLIEPTDEDDSEQTQHWHWCRWDWGDGLWSLQRTFIMFFYRSIFTSSFVAPLCRRRMRGRRKWNIFIFIYYRQSTLSCCSASDQKRSTCMVCRLIRRMRVRIFN